MYHTSVDKKTVVVIPAPIRPVVALTQPARAASTTCRHAATPCIPHDDTDYKPTYCALYILATPLCAIVGQEKELSYVQEFLLEQDDDLRACLDRVGNLESSIAATPRRARNTAGET